MFRQRDLNIFSSDSIAIILLRRKHCAFTTVSCTHIIIIIKFSLLKVSIIFLLLSMLFSNCYSLISNYIFFFLAT